MCPRLLKRGTRARLSTIKGAGITLVLLLFFTTLPARATTPSIMLSEQEVLRLGLERPEIIQQLQSTRELAESDIIEARTWDNPEISFDQESEDDGPEDITSRSYMVSQKLNLSGQRGLKTQAARQRLNVVSREIAQWQIEKAAEIRRKFYAVLYQQQLHEIFSKWRSEMDAMEVVMEKRMKAGDISGYDLGRLKREQSFVQASQRQAHAEHDRLTQELLAIIGRGGHGTPLPGVTGSLLPETPPLPLENLLAQVAKQPGLVAMDLEGKTYGIDERLATQWWLSDLTLGVGVKDVENGQGDAMLFTLSMPIPVFDRNGAALQRAKASQRQQLNKYKLALSEREGMVRGLWNQASELAGAVQSLVSEKSSQTLVQTAEVAYQAGEIGVLEIIDAYRSSFENRAQILSIMRQARMVRIELDLITGENSP